MDEARELVALGARGVVLVVASASADVARVATRLGGALGVEAQPLTPELVESAPSLAVVTLGAFALPALNGRRDWLRARGCLVFLVVEREAVPLVWRHAGDTMSALVAMLDATG